MTMALDNRSVTRHDAQPWYNYWSPSSSFTPAHFPDPEELPNDWRSRDAILRKTTTLEGFWGAANRIAINQMASLEWHIEGGKIAKNRAVAIIESSDYQRQLRLVAGDFFRTNNGAFIEVIRATAARGSRILGFRHLDSNRCQRTGDAENPVIYYDRLGGQHLLKWWQVIAIVDEESSDILANGMGECAAEHAYKRIYKFATIERYLLEKTGGRRPTAMHLVNNISSQTLASAFASGDAPQAQIIERIGDGGLEIEGLGGNSTVGGVVRSHVYKGAMIVPLQTNAPISLVTIPFAALPDNFVYAEELETTLLIYAKALNIDPQDLAPLKGGQFGTGTQSKTLQEKNDMYGAASFKQQWTRAMQIITGNNTVFYMTENDVARKVNEATISKMHTDDLAVQVEKGIITATEARQIKVSYDELPDSFMPSADDTTADQYSLDEVAD